MTQPRFSLLLGLAAVLAAGCGGSAPTPAEVAVPIASAAPSGAASSNPPGPGTASSSQPAPGTAPQGRDPKIMALAAQVLTCKFEDDEFEYECPAFKAWFDDADGLFTDGKGDDTVLSMLSDPDLKVRVLANHTGLAPASLADKARASRLFAVVKAERDASLARGLVSTIARIDAEKLGLQSELKALAHHPSVQFREMLAFYVITKFQTPIALEVEQMLIDDADPRVRETAVSALSSNGNTPAVEPVCKLLEKQIARPDDLAAVALVAGTSSKCAGMKDRVAAELMKRVADPSKVTHDVGITYGHAADGLCGWGTTAAHKKTGFEVGKMLTDARLPDSSVRRVCLRILWACDPTAAEKVFRTLAKDKDSHVAEGAQNYLDGVVRNKKNKKK